jgi:hypothetical protein
VKLLVFLRDVALPKRTVKKGVQTPAKQQARKKQGEEESQDEEID